MEKYIHYCWFGNNKLPKLAKKCIKSWKKYLPEYKIIEWNEKNFDVNITKFSKQAYEEKNWAFVSDVARVYALKEMGGIYFDTDMMITNYVSDNILEKDFFVGWESDINIAVGVLGAKKGNKIIQKLFDIYSNTNYDKNNLYSITIPRMLTQLLTTEYKMKPCPLDNQLLAENTYILARDYFYPISSDKSLPNSFTQNTCMIHYYSGSWLPRDQKLQFKFSQIFGEKLGNFILKSLVKIKHILIKLKNFFKKLLILFLYPIVKMRREKYINQVINSRKQQFNDSLEKISTNYIVFHHSEWLGISNATHELFGENSIGILELYNKELIDYYVKKIIDKKIKLVVFSGFADGWEQFVRELKKQCPNIIIKIIWHGSLCLNIYDYDYLMFTSIFRLLKSQYVNSIAFVKKSMYEFFNKKGYNVEFIANNVTLNKNNTKKHLKKQSDKIRIGIYASGDRWMKNFYNQLAATSLIENCIVDVIPLNYKTYELANLFNIKMTGLSSSIHHNDLLKRMADNDINLYVTFSECAPIIPLESLELGVPCLTANNHHYFANSKLSDYLIVDENDDVNAIYEKIENCLKNKKEIMNEYKKWKKDYNIVSKKSVEDFLKI